MRCNAMHACRLRSFVRLTHHTLHPTHHITIQYNTIHSEYLLTRAITINVSMASEDFLPFWELLAVLRRIDGIQPDLCCTNRYVGSAADGWRQMSTVQSEFYQKKPDPLLSIQLHGHSPSDINQIRSDSGAGVSASESTRCAFSSFFFLFPFFLFFCIRTRERRTPSLI